MLLAVSDGTERFVRGMQNRIGGDAAVPLKRLSACVLLDVPREAGHAACHVAHSIGRSE